MPSCTHLDHAHITRLPEPVDGCEDCLAAGDGWLHLRICLECGKVGCCDDSPIATPAPTLAPAFVFESGS